MKKYVVVASLAAVLAVAAGVFLFVQKDNQSFNTTNPEYNPNYADAIQQKKPELCQNINYALQSGPSDSIDKIHGKKAIEICESQAKSGTFGCECDSASVLNSMRNTE